MLHMHFLRCLGNAFRWNATFLLPYYIQEPHLGSGAAAWADDWRGEKSQGPLSALSVWEGGAEIYTQCDSFSPDNHHLFFFFFLPGFISALGIKVSSAFFFLN